MPFFLDDKLTRPFCLFADLTLFDRRWTASLRDFLVGSFSHNYSSHVSILETVVMDRGVIVLTRDEFLGFM